MSADSLYFTLCFANLKAFLYQFSVMNGKTSILRVDEFQ